jgi:hypothetical protein
MSGAVVAAIQFAFIVLVPLVVVGGALVSLFAVGALFDALEHPGELQSRVEALFRRPPRSPRTPGPDHYYQPHWSPQEPRKASGA